MAWNEHTTFSHAGFRGIKTFRVFRNLGCVLMWKPWLCVIGFERYRNGGAVYLGPLAAGFGPINEDLPFYSDKEEQGDG